MHVRAQMAVVAMALGLGLLTVGPAEPGLAFAQAIGGPPEDAQPDDAQPADAQPADAQASDAQASDAPVESAGGDASPAPTDTQPSDETSPGGAAAASAIDAPAVDAQAADAPAETAGDDGPGAGDQQPVQGPSGPAQRLAEWVIASGDNGDLPFVIVDKVSADVFVFDADGGLLGAAPVLVGLAPGDDSADGVGDRSLSAIKPSERTTPAGRFVARFGAAAGDQKVLWVDYADSISLHPVVTTNPKEHRLERIRSQAPEDHRITYGCINVPATFYRDVVLKAFAGGDGVVYILPETRPLEEVFPGLGVFAQANAAKNAAVDVSASDSDPRQEPGGGPPDDLTGGLDSPREPPSALSDPASDTAAANPDQDPVATNPAVNETHKKVQNSAQEPAPTTELQGAGA